MEDRTQEDVWFVALEAGGLVAAGGQSQVADRLEDIRRRGEARGEVGLQVVRRVGEAARLEELFGAGVAGG
jgi:hypothetical protein